MEADPAEVPSVQAQAGRPCPLAARCGDGARCVTRAFLVCEAHRPALYICPIKNRGRMCPRCGRWVGRVERVMGRGVS